MIGDGIEAGQILESSQYPRVAVRTAHAVLCVDAALVERILSWARRSGRLSAFTEA